MPGTLTVTGAAPGLGGGQNVFGPVTAVGATTIADRFSGALSSGDNTIPVPTGAVMAFVVFPSTLSGTVKARTNLNSGDAGIQLTPVSSALFAVVPLPSGTTSLILNGAGTLTGITEVAFI